MFVVLSITNDGIDQIFGYTNNEKIAKAIVQDLCETQKSEYHDYIYKIIEELK